MPDLPLDVPRQSAFFFDFDGTLVDIAPRPELVVVPPEVSGLLRALEVHFGGAIAIITGRPLAAVDNFLTPIRLAMAAEHGSVRRDSSGALHVSEGDAGAVAAAYGALQTLADANPGLLLERKTSSLALHYRQRPELGDLCAATVEETVAANPGLIVLPGKMVFELKPKGIDKGVAVRAFMAEPPFLGRTPIFAGDDVTDEHAFAVVNALGGISVKIDEGATEATYRTNRAGLIDWLSQLTERS